MVSNTEYMYSEVQVNKRLLEAAGIFHTLFSTAGDADLGAFIGERAHLDKLRSLGPVTGGVPEFTDLHFKTVVIQKPPPAIAAHLPPAQPVASVPSTRRSVALNKKPEEPPVTNAQLAEVLAAVASITSYTGMYAPTSKKSNTPTHRFPF
jgi:hypothetical protein